MRGISFEARPGTVTALVGSSGSGKSTIISLICGFHKPNSGKVLVDGIDLAAVEVGCIEEVALAVIAERNALEDSIRNGDTDLGRRCGRRRRHRRLLRYRQYFATAFQFGSP